MKLYNTLTRQIEELQTLEPGHVKMYTCGITVYGQPHIGNWVGYIYWDLLQRTLESEGYHVERTQNYTDVGHLTSDDDDGEDKMEKGASREGITAWDVADRYIQICDHEAYDMLGLKRPTNLIRATSLIDEQVEFVKSLEHRGFTYVIPSDGVYFDTSKLSDYGKLARLDINGLEAGARVSVEGKRSITDFALWKFNITGKKRDMEWGSPWGVGFPGWHLECSVIARETLGDQIDIHCGGVDHIPVHHTNEIAQTESLTGKPFSTVWVHNNHLKVDGGKMSKSLGNIYTLKDIAQRGIDIMGFKYLVLSKHYSTEGNFTWKNLDDRNKELISVREAHDLIALPVSPTSDLDQQYFVDVLKAISNALSDNLDTPTVLRHLGEAAKRIKEKGLNSTNAEYAKTFFIAVDQLLGFNFTSNTKDLGEVSTLIKDFEVLYAQAKQTNDFSRSDELRRKIESLGYKLGTSSDGKVTWLAEMRATSSGTSTVSGTLSSAPTIPLK